MNKKKLAIRVVIVVILAAGIIYATSSYLDEQDRKQFNQTIQLASTIENISDIAHVKKWDKGTIKVEDDITSTEEEIKNTTDEIKVLEEFKNSTRNETYRQYLEIQIDRLTVEKRYEEAYIPYMHAYQKYKKGEMSLSNLNSQKNSSSIQVDELVKQSNQKKTDAINFLEKHPDLNKTLVDLKIDEDFNTLEWGGDGDKNSVLYYV